MWHDIAALKRVMFNLFLWSKVYSLFRCMRSLSEEPLICRWMLKAVCREGVPGEQRPCVIPLCAPGRRRAGAGCSSQVSCLRHLISFLWSSRQLLLQQMSNYAQISYAWPETLVKAALWKSLGFISFPNFTDWEKTLLTFLVVDWSSPIHVPHSQKRETLKEWCLISRYVPVVRLWAYCSFLSQFSSIYLQVFFLVWWISPFAVLRLSKQIVTLTNVLQVIARYFLYAVTWAAA